MRKKLNKGKFSDEKEQRRGLKRNAMKKEKRQKKRRGLMETG